MQNRLKQSPWRLPTSQVSHPVRGSSVRCPQCSKSNEANVIRRESGRYRTIVEQRFVFIAIDSWLLC
jgi:hypothetical protein